MIGDNVKRILQEIPQGVSLVAATKKRSSDEILEAIGAGIETIGESYIQEAEKKFEKIGNKVQWHFLGHLQKNKVKKAVRIFDMIESLDSVELAQALDRECQKINKIMPVLIEVNIAKEEQKQGVVPEKVGALIEGLLRFENIKLSGIMTMGPLSCDSQSLRPFFKQTKEIFQRVRDLLPENSDWQYLSMGMSDSYKVAIEEGANIIRIGTAIFGVRN